jgi:hypothetical protein
MNTRAILALTFMVLLHHGLSWSLPITVSVRSPEQLEPGEIFMVDLIADLPDPVLGFGLDLAFDESLLRLTMPPAVGDLWSPGLGFDADGLAGLAFPPVSGEDILLARLTFEALAAGISPLQPRTTPGDLTEGFALAFPTAPGSFAEVVFVSGSVTIRDSAATIPEPGTLLLLGTGMASLAVLGRRRRPPATV